MFVKFTVNGVPAPKGSTKPFLMKRKDGTQFINTVPANKNTKPWEKTVHDTAQPNAPREAFGCPIDMSLVFTFERPNSVSVTKRPYPTVKPDLDKLIRTIFDALTDVFYKDDAQVIHIEAWKQYGITPGVEITIKELSTNQLFFEEMTYDDGTR